MSESAASTSSRPVTVRIAGRVLTTWTHCEVGRDLADIAGSFRIEYLDVARSDALLGADADDGLGEMAAIRDRDPVEILVAGKVVLRGWVDDVLLRADEHSASAIITGRDVTGDLVDCSVNPIGPGEYRNIRLESLVGTLTQPFGITLDRQVETGAPFTLVALDQGDTVMGAIEKHTRQRGVLVTSDGVGGIVLTQGGTTQAPEALSFPGNVRAIDVRMSGRGRYSDVYVKGQFRSQLRPAQATLKAGSAPLEAIPSRSGASPSNTSVEEAASCRYGHCVDPAVTRYRPRAWMSATQSGGSVATQQSGNPALDAGTRGLSGVQIPAWAAYHGGTRHMRRKRTKPREASDPWTLQDQAQWRMRSSRANTTARIYVVPSLATASGDLWLPNQLVAVSDSYSGIDQTMLIGAVTWAAAPEGYETRISVVDPDVYDLTGDEDHRKPGARKSRHLTARSMLGRG
ncbi:phage baseplate assembly protein [Acidomonas methanolica]|uniref:Mu P family protein n=1 Tax=Acidomonas methanolica NBRC 104435 TaxID=1231351 RepID=A0A023D7X8_ACIMT|nr:hypothetical protein [Acidomonas methanolica]TCS32412.1 prophage tail gpP-like protein [Acidomonas methanolica]GAJ30214.1 hypothetical protein Amme_112_002 [Acidomonas methanolica NBRC 104435]GBQ52842.1 Mu P family protein [Acidomonas methanolica]GEK97848.1 hypothetical protein AME01nite_03470 [Acidomonas methanolica NBRC 104435]